VWHAERDSGERGRTGEQGLPLTAATADDPPRQQGANRTERDRLIPLVTPHGQWHDPPGRRLRADVRHQFRLADPGGALDEDGGARACPHRVKHRRAAIQIVISFQDAAVGRRMPRQAQRPKDPLFVQRGMAAGAGAHEAAGNDLGDKLRPRATLTRHHLGECRSRDATAPGQHGIAGIADNPLQCPQLPPDMIVRILLGHGRSPRIKDFLTATTTLNIYISARAYTE
jgi:hypothetical protein